MFITDLFCKKLLGITLVCYILNDLGRTNMHDHEDWHRAQVYHQSGEGGRGIGCNTMHNMIVHSHDLSALLCTPMTKVHSHIYQMHSHDLSALWCTNNPSALSCNASKCTLIIQVHSHAC